MYGDISFQFVGTVSQDREISVLQSGQDRATINVAINTPRKNRDTGEFEEITTWVRLAVFGDKAKSASVDRCLKGMPIFVRGTIQSYTQELSGRNYTFYNFRPDIIRPLLSVEQLESVVQARQHNSASRQTQAKPPQRAAAPERAAEPASGSLPENDGAEYFND